VFIKLMTGRFDY